jgi:radical SAM protein with 4Fe4S-binding SPASM domain
MELFKKIIDEARDFIYDINLFLGGESLLHKHLVPMIEYAKANCIKVRLNTNATILTPDKSEELIKAGLDHITFSFDGYDKETYEKIRVKAKFGKTLGNVLNFLEKKKTLNKRNPYSVIQVIEFSSLSKEDTDIQREKFLKQFEGLPLDRIVRIKPHNWAGKYQDGNVDDYRPRGDKYVFCTFLWYSMNILWDGRVVPCCQDMNGEYVLGDASSEGLLDIWNGKKMVELRRKIVNKEYNDISICKECDVLWKEGVMGVPFKSIKALKAYFEA